MSCPSKSLFIILTLMACCTFNLHAQGADSTAKAAKREAVRQHIKAHIKPYGFIRNFFTFDSRECVSGTADLFSYVPKDNNWNQPASLAATTGVAREDLNAAPSFRFLSLTTRAGLNIVGYKLGSTQFDGKIEADFYAGLTGSTGVAQFRLRHAYMSLSWDSLLINKTGSMPKAMRVELLLGQTWHPMATDLPDIISLNSGAPFGPFSRTPQVRLDARFAPWISLTAAALWQMQYTSAGPEGASANYIKYACTPEGYVGLNFYHGVNFLFRAGVDVLSIKPRRTGMVETSTGMHIPVSVKDRLTTFSPYAYLEFWYDDFTLKAKTIFAQGGEHMNLNGGYAVSAMNTNGSWEYTPTRNSSTWVSLSYGSDIKGVLFAGYVQNFGTAKPIVDANHLYFSKNSFSNLNRLWRLSPALVWTIGEFQLGIEYELTSAQYGDAGSFNLLNGLAQNNLHWVTNHRVQLMAKFVF